VRLWITVNGKIHPAAAVGGEMVYFAVPTRLPLGPAQLCVEVDGRAQTWEIVLRGAGEDVNGGLGVRRLDGGKGEGGEKGGAQLARTRFSFVDAG